MICTNHTHHAARHHPKNEIIRLHKDHQFHADSCMKDLLTVPLRIAMCIPDMVQEILGILPAGPRARSAELATVALHLTSSRTSRSTPSLVYTPEIDHATLGELHIAMVRPLISRLPSQLELRSHDYTWNWKHNRDTLDHGFLRPILPTGLLNLWNCES
jgi:hypothetical protein